MKKEKITKFKVTWSNTPHVGVPLKETKILDNREDFYELLPEILNKDKFQFETFQDEKIIFEEEFEWNINIVENVNDPYNEKCVSDEKCVKHVGIKMLYDEKIRNIDFYFYSSKNNENVHKNTYWVDFFLPHNIYKKVLINDSQMADIYLTAKQLMQCVVMEIKLAKLYIDFSKEAR